MLALTVTLMLGIVALNWPITIASASPSTPTAQTSSGNQSTTQNESAADVAAKANPATVTITNYQPQRDPFSGQSQGGEAVPYGVGSGYIISEDGYVVTNNHVTEGGTKYTVQFEDGTTVDATLVGADAFQDVAVLKLDLSGGVKVPGVLSFGDSSTMRAGDEVIAIGSPYGEYTNSVSDGTIAAMDRALDTGEGYSLPNLIQHSAPIYEGNSGGPLLNLAGEVIGMNVAKATNQSQMGLQSNDQSGIGFAIESNAVKPLVDEIIKNGSVARPYLGIQSQPTQDGQGVVSVEADSPAATAGLKDGDIITGIDGQSIDADHPFLNMLIFGHKPGDKVDLSVDRNGQTITLPVTLGTRPAETQ
jgi:S1-C subfamily serine protease